MMPVAVESFFIVLREGLEALLVVAALAAFLQRAGEVQTSHEQRLIERIGVEGRDQLLRLLGKLTDLK